MKKVLKSRIVGTDFNGAVDLFAAELTAWNAHMAKVGVDPEYVACPRPSASQLVEGAVSVADGVARPDFEIVDDLPTTEQLLRSKKDQLLVLVSKLEREASAAAVPVGKRRLFSIQESDIKRADTDRFKAVVREDRERRESVFGEKIKRHAEELAGATAKKAETLRSKHEQELRDALGPELSQEDVAKHVEDTRSPEHAAFLLEQERRTQRLDAIARHGAMLQHEIEDLTVDSIDGWKPAPFPT